MQNNSKFEKMTQAPVEKLICSLALPTIISMMISTIYNTADTYFAGKINTNAVAAIGIAYSFMSIIQAFGFWYGHGSGNFISRMLGKKNLEDAESMASLGLLFSICTGIIFAICTIIFGEYIAILLGGNELIKEDIVSYLKMLSFGIPFIMGGLTLNNQFRYQGNALLGMKGITVGGILNIILDPVFMFVLGFGVEGAGIATSISQFISFFLLLYLNKKCDNVKYSLRSIKYSISNVKTLYLGGLPNFAREAIASIAVLMLNQAVKGYGEVAIAAFTVINRIIMLFGAVMIGFGQGFQPVCAYNYGAGFYKRVKKALYFSLGVSTIFFIIMTVICLGMAENILVFFSSDSAVIEMGTLILKYQCISIPIMGWIIISGMFLQNLGRFKQATIVSAARQGIFFIPLIVILPHLFGLYGIILVQPLADIGTFLISFLMGIKAIVSMDGV